MSSPLGSSRSGLGRFAKSISAALSLLLTGFSSGCLAFEHGAYLLSGPPVVQSFSIDFPAQDLPAMGEGSPTEQPLPLWTLSPVHGWVHGFSIELLDARGDSVPSALLHHVKVMKPDQRELFNPIMLRLVGAGSETRGFELPRSLGFPIEVGDSLLATAMLHNGSGTGYEEVRIRVRLLYTAGPSSPSPRTVYPFFLHVTSADDHSEYDLPPGRSTRTWETSPAVAGEIIGFGGHAHAFAVELRFEDVTSGETLWLSQVERNASGDVLSIPRTVFRSTRGPTIYPSHVYRLTVVYDNPTGGTLVGAGMGTMAGVLRPHEPWPAVDREDPLYLLDRARELDGSAAVMDHTHH